MRFVCLIFALGFAIGIHAQQLARDVRGMGMGNAGVALTGGTALFANPAGLAATGRTDFLAGASSRFELAELTSVWLGAALPVSQGAFGFRLEAFGFDTWKQQRASLMYARQLHDRLRLAVNFSYMQNSITGYGRQGKLSGGFGLQAELKPDLTLGVQVENPFPVRFAEGDYLPTEFSAGLAWRVSGRLLLAVQSDKTLNYPLRFRSGMEYSPIDKLQIRFGFATDPAEYSGGIGLEISNGIVLEMATTYHQVLGFSPAILFRYGLGFRV
ncbi:MAG: hypothetical protein Kow0027_31490 [Saprospiraceae bacterium]